MNDYSVAVRQMGDEPLMPEHSSGRRQQTPVRRRTTSAPARRALGSRAARRSEPLWQRAVIQRVAEELFANQGYRGTSIHLVAARAGCSVGHLYNLYENKLGLYRAIVEAKIQALAGLTDCALARDVPADQRLDWLLRQVLEFFEKNTSFFGIYMAETGPRLWQGNRPFTDRVSKWRGDGLEQVAQIIRQGQSSGCFRPEADARAAAVSLLGVVKAHVIDWIWTDAEGSLTDRAEVILDILTMGIGRKGCPA